MMSEPTYHVIARFCEAVPSLAVLVPGFAPNVYELMTHSCLEHAQIRHLLEGGVLLVYGDEPGAMFLEYTRGDGVSDFLPIVSAVSSRLIVEGQPLGPPKDATLKLWRGRPKLALMKIIARRQASPDDGSGDQALENESWIPRAIFAVSVFVSLLQVFEKVVVWTQGRSTLAPVFETLFFAIVVVYVIRALLWPEAVFSDSSDVSGCAR